MRLAFAVFILLIVYAASYPSFNEIETDNDESNNDLELELRSILNHFNDERSLTTDDDEDLFTKRQGGLNTVNKQTKCEIECVFAQRNPKVGKAKTVKDAAKACKSICLAPAKKRGEKKTIAQRTSKQHNMNLRELDDDDDDSSNNSEEQQNQRREFYDYLMEQLQQNNHE